MGENMKFIHFIVSFMIVYIASCSDLNVNNIKCDNDSNKCPSDSICYDNTCRVCPENSIKSGDTCICDNTDDFYYYKAKNKCESLVCAPENGLPISRPSGCQDGLGYCIKEEGEVNGVCNYNYCTTNLDCPENEQCTFSDTRLDNIIYLTCQKIGSIEIGNLCSPSKNCKIGLSCLKDDNDEESTCQEVCIPGNDLITCHDGRTCIDYVNFNEKIPSKIIGACLDETVLCEFTSNEYNSINTLSCNDKKGVCIRDDLDINIGLCVEDKCNPIESDCIEGNKCVFNGQIYACKATNTDVTGIDGSSCENDSTCNTGLTCVDTQNGKQCKRLCRPNNTYSYTDCLLNQECTDLSTIIPDTAENVLGACMSKVK
jgi:hypothetical protein